MDTNYESVANPGQALADFENKEPNNNFTQVDGFPENTGAGASSLSSNLEIIEGVDSINDVNDTTLTPYKYICSLSISFDNPVGMQFASGFFISKRCVITAGHCVHQRSVGWAQEIKVTPAFNSGNDPFGMDTSQNFRSLRGWVESNPQDSQYDVGAIILNDDTLFNKVNGYFGYLEPDIFPYRAKISGYPANQNFIQLDIDLNVKDLLGHMLKYFIFMDHGHGSGYSGSPIYTILDGKYYAIGVHHGPFDPQNDSEKMGVKVKGDVLQRWSEWKQFDTIATPLIKNKVKEINIKEPLKGTVIVSENHSLNVRSGPGTNFSIVKTLKRGDKVKITDINNSWYKISNNEEWVASNFIKII